MPTFTDMNSLGEPFTALRRPTEITTPAQEVAKAKDAIIAQLRIDLAARYERIFELTDVADEWEAVATDKQKQIEALRAELERERTAHAALREMVRIDRDMRRESMTRAEREAGDALRMFRSAKQSLASADVEKLRPAAGAPMTATEIAERLRDDALRLDGA